MLMSFFVISGYLMTSIVVEGLEKNSFSFKSFYLSRIRRILPALVVLVLFVLLFGWFYLATPFFQKMSKEAFTAILFYSNIAYGLEGSYFSQPFGKWLLHTWTLGVEMQFYMLYPIFLFLVWRLFENKILRVSLVVALTVVSFALCVVIANWKPTIAFYLLPTRAWEFLVGGLVFLFGRNAAPSSTLGKYLNYLGFMLFFVSLYLIDTSTTWPSYWALLPTLSACLIIFSKQQSNIFTDHPIFQWLGNISYSVYLWHWPIVVSIHYLEMNDNISIVLIGVLLSLALGHLSYVMVENPVRIQVTKISYRFQSIMTMFTVLFFAGILSVTQNHSFEWRIDSTIDTIAEASKEFRKDRSACQPDINGLNSPGCLFGDKQGATLAYLVGDSHADMVASAVGAAASKTKGNIKFYGRMGCPTIQGVLIDKSSRAACLNFNDWLYKELDNANDELPVIFVNSVWVTDTKSRIGFEGANNQIELIKNKLEEELLDNLCRLSSKRDVYVVLPIPNADGYGPEIIAKRLILGKLNVTKLNQLGTDIDQQLERSRFMRDVYSLASDRCGVKLLDPLPYFCKNNSCLFLENNRHFYYDNNHLNEFGNKKLVPMFERVFK